MEKFNDSLRFDQCMWAEDIAGSKAYAKALKRSGILTEKEREEICQGLEKVHAEWAAGKFEVVVSPVVGRSPTYAMTSRGYGIG